MIRSGEHIKVKDLIQMLEEYPEDKQLDIIYFDESEPWKRVTGDIHDLCYGWYSTPDNKYVVPFTRKRLSGNCRKELQR